MAWNQIITSGSNARLQSLLVAGSVSASAFTGSFTGSLFGTSSHATTSSFAISASWAPAAPSNAFPFSGSAVVTGSLLVSGSGINVTGSLTLRNNIVFTDSFYTSSITFGNQVLRLGNDGNDNISLGDPDVGGITINGNINNSLIPNPSPSLASLDISLGSVSSRWAGGFFRNISASGSITASIVSASSYTSSLVNQVGFFGTASRAISASWAPGGTSGLTTKAGAVSSASFGGSPRSASVTFSSPFANANYAVTVTGEDARSWTIQNKVASSFIINSNSSVLLSGSTYWIATAYGES